MAQTTATAMLPTPRPTRVKGIFTVPSKSYPGEVYTTDLRDPAHPACTCPAGQHDFESCTRVRFCWHVRACEERQDAVRKRLARLHARRRPRSMAALHECFA